MTASSAHISALADRDLAQIFKNLPPFDRLRVSAVCKQWWSVSQDPWLDITHLELTFIPSESIGDIVRKCTNLTSLFCKHQDLLLDDLRNIVLPSFKSLELHGCTYYSIDDEANETTLPLFRSEWGQSMEELVLHKHEYYVESDLSERYSQRLLPVSLKRLQLSGLCTGLGYYDQNSYLTELRKLRALDSLILHSTDNALDDSIHFDSLIFAALPALKNLRELLLMTAVCFFSGAQRLAKIALKLPRLEILFLPEVVYDYGDAFCDLFFKHPTLRILVVPENRLEYPVSPKRPVCAPIRCRFRNGVATKPLPSLHLFVGERAAKLFRFVAAQAFWLSVHHIDAPLPELLEREEIAEIFEGSWIARQIKAGAKRGINFSRYGSGPVDDVDKDND